MFKRNIDDLISNKAKSLNKEYDMKLKQWAVERYDYRGNTDKPFVLHNGFNRMCGLRGTLLSGGQK